MSLTLIQEQVLESLCEAIGDDSWRRDRGVDVEAVQEKLRIRRPRRQSNKYVARILSDLTSQRIGAREIVRKNRSRTVRYVALNAAFEYVERRKADR